MSSFGLFLILFVALLVMIAIIRFLSWLTELQEEHGSLGQAALNTIRRYVSVKHYQDDVPVMSRQIDQTAQTNRTDEPDGRTSEANLWMDRIAVDRTKTTLITLLVYSGWSVEEIRRTLKGENATLGAEIEQVRKQLGIAPQVTPIAQRPTEASYPN